MKIESDDYYRIVLSAEYHKAGKAVIDDVISILSAQQRIDDVESLQRHIGSSYQMDTRCLIGFALAHNEYEFGVGGISHVIGHEVTKPLRLIGRLAEDISHSAHTKIAKMIEEIRSVPNKLP